MWRIGLGAPVKWMERWARKSTNDKEAIASVGGVLMETCLCCKE